MSYTKPGSPFLYDEATNDVVGFKDGRDGSESLVSGGGVVGPYADTTALEAAYPAVDNAGKRALVGASAPYSDYTSNGGAWVAGAVSVIVTNSLTSTSTTNALSAAQGKSLKDTADIQAARIPAQFGVPIAITGNTTLSAAAHDGAILHCSGSPVLTINTGLGARFSVDAIGAFTTAGTATVTDGRETGATGTLSCSLVPTATADTYVLIGSKV